MSTPGYGRAELRQLPKLAFQLSQESFASEAVDQEPWRGVDGHQQAGQVGQDVGPSRHVQAIKVRRAAQALAEVPGERQDELDDVEDDPRLAAEEEQHHDDDQHPGRKRRWF